MKLESNSVSHSKYIWRTYTCVPTSAFYCSFEMLTLYDVLEVAGDDVKRRKWMQKYKMVTDCSVCPACGAAMVKDTHRGKAGMRCSKKACRRRVSSVAGGLLEGSQLSQKEFLLLTYFWAHDCAGERAQTMLGHSPVTVATWSARFRQCVLNQQDATVDILGGPDMEVEADETEIGRKRKGLHGHDKQVLGDIRGVFERKTGKLYLETFDKLCSDSDERRFGPPNKMEASDLFDHIATGSIVFADSAKAYIGPAKDHGLRLSCVDHGSGEYTRKEMLRGKLRVVSTQGIDGAWGNLKTWFNSKGGVMTDHIFGYLKEFQWRHNTGWDNPFLRLCEHIRDGYFQ